MRKQIFTAVAKAVAAVEGIEYVGLYNNEEAMFSEGQTFPMPAVLIEFESIEWKQQNMGARRGTLALRLHLLTRYLPTHGHTDPNIDEALAPFDLLDCINAAMQDLRGDNFSGFMLTTSATNHEHGEIWQNVERYVCDVQDVTAMRRPSLITGLTASPITGTK